MINTQYLKKVSDKNHNNEENIEEYENNGELISKGIEKVLEDNKKVDYESLNGMKK